MDCSFILYEDRTFSTPCNAKAELDLTGGRLKGDLISLLWWNSEKSIAVANIRPLAFALFTREKIACAKPLPPSHQHVGQDQNHSGCTQDVVQKLFVHCSTRGHKDSPGPIHRNKLKKKNCGVCNEERRV